MRSTQTRNLAAEKIGHRRRYRDTEHGQVWRRSPLEQLHGYVLDGIRPSRAVVHPVGLTFDFAMRSWIDFRPLSLLATTTIGISINGDRNEIAQQIGRGRIRDVRIDYGAPVAAIASVFPSGGDFATRTRPSVPPTPALFSTTTCRPSRSEARPQNPPDAIGEAPGAKGTMI